MITGIFLLINNRLQLRSHQPQVDADAEHTIAETQRVQYDALAAENARLRAGLAAADAKIEAQSLRISELERSAFAVSAVRQENQILKAHLARMAEYEAQRYNAERRHHVGPPPRFEVVEDEHHPQPSP